MSFLWYYPKEENRCGGKMVSPKPNMQRISPIEAKNAKKIAQEEAGEDRLRRCAVAVRRGS